MQSLLLLVVTGALIVVPGLAAALLAFPPGRLGILTRLAAVFGLGYVVAGGCAFLLAVTHLFWLRAYVPLWLVCTAVLWVLAWRRGPLRAHISAAAAEIAEHRVSLLLGGVVVPALLVLAALNLHSLPGPHYVYYLNGIQIANSHGIPKVVLEDGHPFPPATDKVFLDAFTGLLPLFGSKVLVGPGVLLFLSFVGAAIGLWAFAWELGLRRIGVLLPVLLLANADLPGQTIATGFIHYRAEDFGIAVTFCAAALGVAAFRGGGLNRALAAGVVLAAATGTHLIPVLIAVVILVSVIVAELLRGPGARPRREIVQNAGALAGTTGVLAVVIRLMTGGTFGLGGAINQSSYNIINTKFDPTAFMFTGANIPRNRVLHSHFYVAPAAVLRSVMHAATNTYVTTVAALLILAAALLLAIVFARARRDLSAAVFAGAGTLFGITLIALYFSYSYTIWIEATFGVRRPTAYASLGLMLMILAIVEAGLSIVGEREWKLPRGVPGSIGWPASIAPVLIVLVCVWLVPGAGPTHYDKQLNLGQQEFATWVRTQTPCGARFLLDQRSEGAVAAMTGRLAVDEGMGSFLRPKLLDVMVHMLLGARSFYADPTGFQSVLGASHVNYVVVADDSLLGYAGPIKPGNIWKGIPFLERVYSTRWFNIYHVKGSRVPGVPKLLRGPYLHCLKTPATF